VPDQYHTIRSEINAAGSATNPFLISSLLFTHDSERELQLLDFEVDEARPYVSAITMIAHSSDWFSAFTSDFDARDVSANAWYQELEVETLPWDAGTADDNFASEEKNALIFMYYADQVPSSGAFASIDGSAVLPVARWTCALQILPTASVIPSVSPYVEPSMIPSIHPSVFPSMLPSGLPSAFPSDISSELPSALPSVLLSSELPTELPSVKPGTMPLHTAVLVVGGASFFRQSLVRRLTGSETDWRGDG
jgi:hypothetical protein